MTTSESNPFRPPQKGRRFRGAGFSGIPKHTLLSAGGDKIRHPADLPARDRQSRFRESGSRFDPCNVRQIIGAGQGFRSGHRRPATASTKHLSGFPFSSRAWHGCHNCQSWYAVRSWNTWLPRYRWCAWQRRCLCRIWYGWHRCYGWQKQHLRHKRRIRYGWYYWHICCFRYGWQNCQRRKRHSFNRS